MDWVLLYYVGTVVPNMSETVFWKSTLRKLHAVLSSQGVELAIVGPHGEVRDLLRRDGISQLVGGVDRDVTLDTVLAAAEQRPG